MEIKPTPSNDGKGGESDFPRKTDGSIDLDAMTPEQKADYWKQRSDEQARGFNEFKEKTQQEIDELKSKIPASPSPEELARKAGEAETLSDFEKMIPGFEMYDEDTQKAFQSFYSNIRKNIIDDFNKDPAIQFARSTYNEKKWNEAFETVASNPQFADLRQSKEEFRKKYFQPHNVPDNIVEILTELAKSFLFDKAREIGAEEERKKQERIDSERANGGDKTPPASRTLADWEYLARTNPKEFARRSKEYQADLDAGKLKE